MPTYDNGSATYSADYSTNFALINKIAKQALYNVKSSNPLDWINKGRIANGVAIEDAIVELTDSYEWVSENQTGANLNAPVYPSIKVTYHSTWNGKQFKTTYSEDQFRKVLLAGGSEMDAASKIAGNLSESEGYEDYQACLGILTQGITAGNILPYKTGATALSASSTDLIIAIKNVIDAMQFVNTSYNAAGIKQRTPFDRIHIIMPYTVRNTLNVDVLASLFNMEKADLLAKITVIDATGYVYIVDEFALLKYTRLYRMTNKFVEDGLYTNYWLTVDRMYGTNNLFKAAYIPVTE